jgi:hypothetical protein
VQSEIAPDVSVRTLIENDLKQAKDAMECVRFAQTLGYLEEEVGPLFEVALSRLKVRKSAFSLLESF